MLELQAIFKKGIYILTIVSYNNKLNKQAWQCAVVP